MVPPLAAYGAIVLAVPPLRTTFRPWLFGRVSLGGLTATCFIAIGSCLALMAFNAIARPDASAYPDIFPVGFLRRAVLAGVLFSILNALFEEVVFRGILFGAVESEWGKSVAAVTTAVLFGFCHLHGYPPGGVGAVLAGVFGLCLGWLRIVTGGIGLPVLAHIAADATIFECCHPRCRFLRRLGRPRLIQSTSMPLRSPTRDASSCGWRAILRPDCDPSVPHCPNASR